MLAAELPGVTQPGREAIDGEVDAALDLVPCVAGAVTLDELHLQVVQRVEIGKAVNGNLKLTQFGFDRRNEIDPPPLKGYWELALRA